MHRNRLGELLVMDGVLSPHDLKESLALSRAAGVPLGKILVERQIVGKSVIRQTLVEQCALRFMMTAITFLMAFASLGGAKPTNAASIRDVPARMAFTPVSAAAPLEHYPKLFGSTEKESHSLSPFTKWIDMFDRFDASLNTAEGQQEMGALKQRISYLQGHSIAEMAEGVNEIINRVPYIGDERIYGKSDYWATPVEFLKKGGDCEDYAITKYVALRTLGVPEERLRLLVLQDLKKNIPHAVLIVYADSGALILDNQLKTATPAERISHYKPIFSINREAWWLHTKPKNNISVMASAAR